MSKIYMALMKQ